MNVSKYSSIIAAMHISDTEAAYLAGFFDGEGSVTICCGKSAARARNPNHILQVSVGNTDPKVIKWIQDKFGGSIHFRVRKKENWRNFAQWKQCATGASDFLKCILPFLRMKKDQANTAIAFQAAKEMKGPKIVPQDVLDWRESQRFEIQRLNARSWIGSEERNRCSTLPRNHKTIADFAEIVLVRSAPTPLPAESILSQILDIGKRVKSKASLQQSLYKNRPSRFKAVRHGLWTTSKSSSMGVAKL